MATVPAAADPAPACGERVEDCRCAEAAGHYPMTVHVCGVQGCHASWVGTKANHTFRPVTLPTWPPIPRDIHTARPALRLVKG
jgi:hypothetical protein